jgi:hypothetical protein
MMSLRAAVGGEGASMPWFRNEVKASPGLILWPMFSTDPALDATVMQEIYRLAYEWAQAMMRPSIYDIAWNPSRN